MGWAGGCKQRQLLLLLLLRWVAPSIAPTSLPPAPLCRSCSGCFASGQEGICGLANGSPVPDGRDPGEVCCSGQATDGACSAAT